MSRKQKDYSYMIGEKYGKLTVIDTAPNNSKNQTCLLCQCDCGNKKIVPKIYLRAGNTTSCGCNKRSRYAADLVGKRFGKLTVLYRTENHDGQVAHWMCKCDCGKTHETTTYLLTSGSVKSCGCLHFSQNNECKSRIYGVWDNMLRRCEKSYTSQYKDYGGRGISVCPEWHNFETFKKWAYENGYDENAKHGQCTLDRIDSDGDYCPANCRWTNAKIQSRNKRNNRYITINGVTRLIKDWADIYKISYSTIFSRLSHGWSDYEAVTTPVGQKRKVV